MTVAVTSVLRRCIYCKAEGVPMTGEGPRKRCSNERDCAARVNAGDPNLKPAPAPTNGRPPLASVSPTLRNPNDMTTAEALIELMQRRAGIQDLDGPVELGERLRLAKIG